MYHFILYWRADKSLARPESLNNIDRFSRKSLIYNIIYIYIYIYIYMYHFILYRGADKSLARPGRKQANVSVRMA